MKLFSKNRLFISLLSSSLSTTFLVSPGYAMDNEERGVILANQPNQGIANQQAQPQWELVTYMEPDQAHLHPRGQFRRLPQGENFTCDLLKPQHVRWEAELFQGMHLHPSHPLPQNLGIARERVGYDFQYLGHSYHQEIICPKMYALQGKWKFAREEKRSQRDAYTLNLTTMVNNQLQTVHQVQPLLGYVAHEQIGEPGPQTPGKCYFDGHSVYQKQQRMLQWKSPRAEAQPYAFLLTAANGDVHNHKGRTVIYVEPFPLDGGQPKESYTGEYDYVTLLDADEEIRDRETRRLLYSNGTHVYLPHVTQERWIHNDQSGVGFFIASFKEEDRINFIPHHVLGAPFLEGLYHLSSVQDSGNQRLEKWKKLGEAPHEVNLRVLSRVSSVPGMGLHLMTLPTPLPTSSVSYDAAHKILSLKGLVVNANDINAALRVHQNPTQMNIFGLNALLLNVSITCHGTSCSFIAPKIQVDTPVTLDLRGIHGQPGAGGAFPGGNGIPGNPGGNGGNLFMKASILKGLSQLTVNISGGNGGNGGNGAAGANGQNGVDGDLTSGVGNDASRYTSRVYNSKGTDGTSGHNGGRGGQGGKSGVPGSTIFVQGEHSVDNTLRSINQDGREGTSGIGGAGGAGGLHGRHCQGEVRCRDWVTPHGYQAPRGRASSGNPGVGLNTVGLQSPAPQVPLNTGDLMTQYQTYYFEEAKKPTVFSTIAVFPNLQ